MLTIDDLNEVVNLSILSSSDCNNFEYNDDMKDLDIHAKEEEAFMKIMNVFQNPLFDEPPSSSVNRNDDPYWCRDSPLFVENFDDTSNTRLECGLE